MRRVDYGEGDDDLVFLLGYGNRPDHDGVQWLVDHLTDAGYRVSAFELPRTIRDFESEFLEPVEAALAELDSYRLLSHSTGGLIARFVDDDGPVTRTYLSPWWGFHQAMQSPVLPLVLKLPISKPVIPGSAERSDLGELASDEWVEDSPDYTAPTFLREAKRAQDRVPPFDEGDVVFYNPEDSIVGADAIEADVPAANRVRFEGGHELFCSRSRSEHVETVLAAVDRGVEALGATNREERGAGRNE